VGTILRFAIAGLKLYNRRMPRKPIELPPAVAREFVRDMKAFFACGHDTIKADGIAVGTLHSLRQHYNGKLRLKCLS